MSLARLKALAFGEHAEGTTAEFGRPWWLEIRRDCQVLKLWPAALTLTKGDMNKVMRRCEPTLTGTELGSVTVEAGYRGSEGQKDAMRS